MAYATPFANGRTHRLATSPMNRAPINTPNTMTHVGISLPSRATGPTELHLR